MPNAPHTMASEAQRYLDLEGIQSRYGFAKTRATAFVQAPGFVNSVVDGMHRYPVAALDLWDLATALAGTVAEGAATPRPAVVVTPPALGRPGRKPANAKAAR